MRFVKLESPFGDVLVDPEKVAWIQAAGHAVSKIGFTGGAELHTIRGNPDEIVARLNAEPGPHDD